MCEGVERLELPSSADGPWMHNLTINYQVPSINTSDEGPGNSTPLYAHAGPYAYNGVMALCMQRIVRLMLA